ncbi:MAG: response regulator transcription factor [Chloroflexi bacterium]|uniref:Response regulator transcription factor n=1 Tax=Candidatus Chlorohelix allophototropha TaxID=3003348 RepID=A0A8T7M0L7_9CHLR|nr:response regulator transcription factor [Chloroflexota bacterium]WJW67343.1 response regulator transcription factor [Chloroflexota bacterium L227-S17]
MADKTILVVDDERNIVELLKIYLGNEGYNVEVAFNGREALRLHKQLNPALILLDLMLPELDGYEVCRQIRRESNTPIIMLTAKGDDVDTIVGLELGADDYMAKPFNPREVIARVKAVLRRSEHTTDPLNDKSIIIELGNTRIDLARHEVSVNGKLIELRAKEFDLLKVLSQNTGIVLDRDRLLNLVWGYEYFGDTRTVDVHVAHVRDKLEGSSAQIQTIRGSGYKLVIVG